MSRPVARIALGALGAALLLAGAPAFAQPAAPAAGVNPVPRVPDVVQRSGLVSRMMPIVPHLPPDPDRDDYYNTYWNDGPKDQAHPNCYKHSGLYGSLMIEGCSMCNANYWGNPGPGCVPARCTPPHPALRFWTNITHPFRPVGYYYANGCFAPTYSLDPLVPGPGPYPWSVFMRRCNGG